MEMGNYLQHKEFLLINYIQQLLQNIHNIHTRLHDIHVTKVPYSSSGGLVGLLESSFFFYLVLA